MTKYFLFFIAVIFSLNTLLLASNDLSRNNLKLQMTKKENIWIQENSVIRVGYMKSYPPYEFVEKKTKKGFNLDYIQELTSALDIQVEFVLIKSFADVKNKIKNQEIDLFAGFNSYVSQMDSVILTRAFLSSFDSIVTRKDDSFLANYKHLYGKKVAVIGGYGYETIIEKYHPEITIELVKTPLEGFKKVNKGDVDAFLSNNDISLYLFNKYEFKNLRTGIPANFPNIKMSESLNFAIRNDWVELKTILDKSIKDYSNKKLVKLEKKWLDPTKNKISAKIEFTQEEKEWMASNVIKVGAQMDWIPFDFVNGVGEYRGIVKDLLTLISKKTGLQFEYKTGQSWNELLESFQDGNIDLMPALYLTESRQKYAYFTRPYMKIRNYIFMRSNEPSITSMSEIENKRVAYVDGYNALDKVIIEYPNIEPVKVKSIEEGIEAVIVGKADFYVEDYPIVMFHLSSGMQTGIKPTLAVPHDQKNLHMAINKNNKMLIQIINKIEAHMSYSEVNAILTKWLYTNNTSSDIIFTKKELEWISKNKTLTYSEIDWQPLTIVENNSMQGIIADYLDIVQQNTGINFVFKRSSSWSEVLEKFKSGEIDFIPGRGEYSKSFESGFMSDKYVEYPMVIISKKEMSYIKSLKDIKDKTFSVPKHFTTANYLKTLDPNIKVIESKTIEEALLNVSNGLADVYIGHLAPALYYLKKIGRKNLQISGNTELKFQHHFLISEKHAEFVSIVNKTMDKVSKTKKDEIYNKWVKTEIKSNFDYTIVWTVMGIFLMIIMVIIYYNRKVADQKKFFETLINSQEQMIITTDGKKVLSANETFLNFYNVENEIMFREVWHECISDTFDQQAPENFIHKTKEGLSWLEYILANGNKVHKVRIIKNNQLYIFSVTASKLPGEAKLMSAVFTDITEIEKVKDDIESIISNILLPVIIVSQDEKRVLYLNKYAEEIFEITLEDSINKQTNDIYYLDEGDSELLDILETQGYIKNYEKVMNLASSDKKFIALISASKIRYLGQESYIGMFIDISKMKQMENEIRLNHKKTKDSIQYASLIQETFIPDNKLFLEYFSDYFSIWQPKDIVGGDIYLYDKLRNDDECLLMVIDCTGHGVPGAFVTMLVKAIERQIVSSINYDNNKVVSPAQILSIFNKHMKTLLKQHSKDSVSNEGFDGGVIYYNKKESIIRFAAAHSSLFYIQDKKLTRIKGDRQSIGDKKSDSNYVFKEYTINVEKGMQFYISTDGFIDQCGGEKDLSFGKRRFSNLIEQHHEKSLSQQKTLFLDSLKEYQGDSVRNDDITVISFKI